MASEVMKVKLVAGVTDSENDLLAAPSGKTLTILNISICETGGTDETLIYIFEMTPALVIMKFIQIKL